MKMFINCLHGYSRLPIAMKALNTQMDKVPHSVDVNQLFFYEQPQCLFNGLIFKTAVVVR